MTVIFIAIKASSPEVFLLDGFCTSHSTDTECWMDISISITHVCGMRNIVSEI
jgi:hypothetical protein